MNAAAANMFSTISFCGEVTFPYHLNLFRVSQARDKSKSREKRFKGFLHFNSTSKKDTPKFKSLSIAANISSRKLLKALSPSTVIILLTRFSEYGQK